MSRASYSPLAVVLSIVVASGQASQGPLDKERRDAQLAIGVAAAKAEIAGQLSQEASEDPAILAAMQRALQPQGPFDKEGHAAQLAIGVAAAKASIAGQLSQKASDDPAVMAAMQRALQPQGPLDKEGHAAQLAIGVAAAKASIAGQLSQKASDDPAVMAAMQLALQLQGPLDKEGREAQLEIGVAAAKAEIAGRPNPKPPEESKDQKLRYPFAGEWIDQTGALLRHTDHEVHIETLDGGQLAVSIDVRDSDDKDGTVEEDSVRAELQLADGWYVGHYLCSAKASKSGVVLLSVRQAGTLKLKMALGLTIRGSITYDEAKYGGSLADSELTLKKLLPAGTLDVVLVRK